MKGLKKPTDFPCLRHRREQSSLGVVVWDPQLSWPVLRKSSFSLSSWLGIQLSKQTETGVLYKVKQDTVDADSKGNPIGLWNKAILISHMARMRQPDSFKHQSNYINT